MTPHKRKASTRIGGKDLNAGGLKKTDTRIAANLANARVPKYTANIFFLELIAYTLTQSRNRNDMMVKWNR